MCVGGQRHAPAALPQESYPVPIVQEAEWAPGPVWTGTDNLPPPVFDPQTVETVETVASSETDWDMAVLLRREDSSTVDIKDVSWVDLALMYLVLDKVRWQAVVHKVTNLQVPQEALKFCSGWFWVAVSSCRLLQKDSAPWNCF